MVITQKIMRNVSLTAHPLGCNEYIKDQLAFLEGKEFDSKNFPKRVLVIGGSTGYGLSSRIVPSILAGSKTINISFEREPSERKTATPGYYMTKAFEKVAESRGLYAKSLFGDAFSQEVKKDCADLIAQDLGQVDLIIYSLASPVRTDPKTQEVYRSVIKPIGEDYTSLSLNTQTGVIVKETLESATEQQVLDTIKVMGGEDWKLWIEYLMSRNVIAEGAKTVAYSYIGPEVTYPMYREGTIGKAKEDLENSSKDLSKLLEPLKGDAYVSVNKALVTRASSVIPVVPLYISLLYDVMKEKNLHEDCIGQIFRLFTDRLYSSNEVPVDEKGRIRIDDLEMRSDVQKEVMRRWEMQKEGQVVQGADLEGFQREYQHIHGFGYDTIDYSLDVDPRVI
jgi:enoyl-[acyl-carrier protein] reductase/trans-2-enoyl-CoA reductase (NAD+)